MKEKVKKDKKPSRIVTWLQNNPFLACVIVLSSIAIIAGVLLGGVNQLTYQSDAEKLAANLNKAYATKGTWETLNQGDYAVTGYDSTTSVTGIYKTISENDEGGTDTVYIYATTSKGYKSGLNLMVVVKNDKIVKIMKTASGETIAKPLSEENFSKYYNVNLLAEGFNGFRTNKQSAADGKTEIVAITGATKSSNAICNSVDVVVAYHKLIAGGNEL